MEQQASTDVERNGHAVALLDGSCAGDAAAQLLLEDFASALAAYAWMSGAQKPRVHRPGYGGAANLPDNASAIAIALPADAGVDENLARALAALGHASADSTPPLVYAIAYIKERASEKDAVQLDSAASICQERSARWGGAVVLGESALYPGLFCSPRLGAYRRPLSQAIDRLVAAVRMNATMKETARITGRASCENVVVANPGLAPLARLLFSGRTP